MSDTEPERLSAYPDLSKHAILWAAADEGAIDRYGRSFEAGGERIAYRHGFEEGVRWAASQERAR